MLTKLLKIDNLVNWKGLAASNYLLQLEDLEKYFAVNERRLHGDKGQKMLVQFILRHASEWKGATGASDLTSSLLRWSVYHDEAQWVHSLIREQEMKWMSFLF